MKEFAPAIIQLVDKEIDPDTICKVLTLDQEIYFFLTSYLKKQPYSNALLCCVQDLSLCTQQQRESALMAPWKKLARAKSF